jgi:hypothetical protein
MSKIPEIRDCFGNIVDKDNFVNIVAPFPLIFKVLVADRGGIHTTNGMTPALLRLMCDINLRKPPGLPFTEVIRVVQQSQEEILSHILDGVGGPPRG